MVRRIRHISLRHARRVAPTAERAPTYTFGSSRCGARCTVSSLTTTHSAMVLSQLQATAAVEVVVHFVDMAF